MRGSPNVSSNACSPTHTNNFKRNAAIVIVILNVVLLKCIRKRDFQVSLLTDKL
jgi:hypothetical protein